MNDHISTKAIALTTGRAVSEINEIARDLGITFYNRRLRSWRVEIADAQMLIAQLNDND